MSNYDSDENLLLFIALAIIILVMIYVFVLDSPTFKNEREKINSKAIVQSKKTNITVADIFAEMDKANLNPDYKFNNVTSSDIETGFDPNQTPYRKEILKASNIDSFINFKGKDQLMEEIKETKMRNLDEFKTPSTISITSDGTKIIDYKFAKKFDNKNNLISLTFEPNIKKTGFFIFYPFDKIKKII